MPFGSKRFESLNYSPGSNPLGDQFGIGRTDNFGGYFSGYIKLPSGYPNGTYNFTLDHDDGVQFYLDGQLKINQTGLGYASHTTSHYLQANTYYPFSIHYSENAADSKLKLWWTPPGLTNRIVGYNAFWY